MGANTLRMLDDLGNRVDHTDSRLRKVTRTMNDFIRKNEGERARVLVQLICDGRIGLQANDRYEELLVYWNIDSGADHPADAGDPHLMHMS